VLMQQGAQAETWGVELSPGRAEKAAACLDRVLPTAWEQARVREDSVSLLFENPPYDHEGIGDSRRQCDLTGLSHNLCEYSAHDFCENRIMLVLGFAHTCGPYLERYPLRQML
jgi:hypothetical protein